MKAVQDEASPAALRFKAPEAQNPMLKEREGVLRRHLPEARDAGSAQPCDGRAEALAAAGELTKSAVNETNSSVRLRSVPCAKL